MPNRLIGCNHNAIADRCEGNSGGGFSWTQDSALRCKSLIDLVSRLIKILSQKHFLFVQPYGLWLIKKQEGFISNNGVFNGYF